ncbi:MAG: phage holin family protein [Lysobacteraceae bacterium]
MNNDHRNHSHARASVAAVAGSAAATGRSLLDLLDSELSLTGRALLRAALIAMIAIALAGVGGLLLASLMVVALQASGLSWLAALSIVTVLTLATCAFAITRTRALLELCGLPATRRQLSRLFRESPADHPSAPQQEPQA